MANPVAGELIDFLNASPTAFHAVAESKKRLKEAGFEHVSEREDWILEPGKKYFFTRNHSTIVAFAIGMLPGMDFTFVGAHTDSPCLKVKPVSKLVKGGCLEVGVQTYGGGLWHTWFDRDLTVAGRVIVKQVKDGSVSYSHKLVRVEEPILRIPMLAIHLDRNVSEGFKVNTQSHLLPVLATSVKNSKNSKDTLQLQLLLTFIQNGITEPWQKIPSVVSIFAAEASFALLDPSQEHFLSISKTMMHSRITNLKDIPLFDKLFESDSIHFKTNRLWILRLLYVGLNVDADADIYIKRELPELLLSFFTFPLSDPESMTLILQLVKKAVKFHKQLERLVQHCGLISWLSSIVSLYTGRLSGDQKDFYLKALGLVLKVINEVISSKAILEWLQDFALEQLSEFLCHLLKLFIGYLNLLKDDISLVNSILLAMLSTLRISQKRKINKPHFTLSLQGLFQLYQAIGDNITNAGFSHTIELGINTILMSTPVPVVTHMDRARLSRLLTWIVSSALWSFSSQKSVGYEFGPALVISFREQEREESLVSKLLRWVTASIILGSISGRSYTENTFNFKRPELKTLQSLLERAKNERKEIGENGCSAREALAIIILYLQQLIERKYTCLPSVITALCLLLPCAASNTTENGLLDENNGLVASLISKIRCPIEANPAWRWLFDQPWEDCSSERTEMELMEEEHACQSLLITFSNALGGKSVGLPDLSYSDVKQFGLFEWERHTFVGNRPCRTHDREKVIMDLIV